MNSSVGRYSWMRVADFMMKNPLTVSPSDTVGQADELMYENQCRQLPVVINNQLAGIITDRDIRSFLSGSLLSDPEARQAAFSTKIAEIMTREPITLSPDDELETAVKLLLTEKFGGVPVVDNAEGLVGIVTSIDLLRCFLNRLQEDWHRRRSRRKYEER
jgi:acetoin utilization protein AcuB